jgi:hypothetical protein
MLGGGLYGGHQGAIRGYDALVPKTASSGNPFDTVEGRGNVAGVAGAFNPLLAGVGGAMMSERPVASGLATGGGALGGSLGGALAGGVAGSLGGAGLGAGLAGLYNHFGQDGMFDGARREANMEAGKALGGMLGGSLGASVGGMGGGYLGGRGGYNMVNKEASYKQGYDMVVRVALK